MKATFNESSITKFIISLGKIVADEIKLKQINIDEKKDAIYIMEDSAAVMFRMQSSTARLTIGIDPEVFDIVFPLLGDTKTENNQGYPLRLALMVDRDLREIEFVSIDSNKPLVGNVYIVKPF